MRLLMTNDGRICISHNDTVRWFDRPELARWYALALYGFEVKSEEWCTFLKEWDYALGHMVLMNHTIAEFGVFGGFLYSVGTEMS